MGSLCGAFLDCVDDFGDASDSDHDFSDPDHLPPYDSLPASPIDAQSHKRSFQQMLIEPDLNIDYPEPQLQSIMENKQTEATYAVTLEEEQQPSLFSQGHVWKSKIGRGRIKVLNYASIQKGNYIHGDLDEGEVIPPWAAYMFEPALPEDAAQGFIYTDFLQ